MIKDYKDFLFENISTGIDLNFMLSERLKDLLQYSKHPIAKKLLEYSKDKTPSKFTLVDYDDDDINNFTYAPSNKILDKFIKDETNYKYDIPGFDKNYDNVRNFINDFISSESQPYWKLNRVSTKIGRVINKIFPKEFKQSGSPGNDLESFTNVIKNLRTKDDNRIKIVKGEELKKYYLNENYNKKAFSGSSLGGSCMKYDYCQDYINFYAENNIEMVILLSNDDDTKIDARAILWTISNVDGDEIERKFMDRIYPIYDHDINKLKDYAKKNNWLYKNIQNMNAREEICDPIDDTCYSRNLRTSNNIKKSINDKYPYMDTMKFFHTYYGYLTNEEEYNDDVYVLEETDGSYIIEGKIYVDYYGEWYDDDDLIWCEMESTYRTPDDAIYVDSENEWYTKEYADNNCVYSDLMDEWIMSDDSVYIESKGDYVTQRYAENNLDWNRIEERWMTDDESVFSEYHNAYLDRENSIEVETENGDDWRGEGDNTYFEYYDDKTKSIRYFDEYTMEDDFIIVYVYNGDESELKGNFSPNNVIKKYKHKEWDKNYIFKWNGRNFYDNTGLLKDKLTGQKRIWENYR